MGNGPIVAFTGHRPDALGSYANSALRAKVIRALDSALKELKPKKAISGMALGVDQWAAQLCVVLKIPFIAAVPFRGQEEIWPKDSQVDYRHLLKKATEVVYVTDGGYEASAFQARNRWMVDHCDLLIAVWDGYPGGTSKCVWYAEQVERKIIRIDPSTL